MTLTPEQEALVEAAQVADAKFLSANYSDASYPYGKYKSRDEFTAARVRAIIPLIYTAGRRAGIEEALTAQPALTGGVPEPSPADLVARYYEAHFSAFEGQGYTTEYLAAIRNLSEQESGR